MVMRMVLATGYNQNRTRFVNEITRIGGSVPVAGWLAHRDDNLSTLITDPWSGRVWTAEAVQSVVTQGKGHMRTFNGTSSRFSTPDTATLSFTTGAADQAFSVFVAANVADTAANREMIGKFTSLAVGEWDFFVDASDKLTLQLTLAGIINVTRVSNAAIAQGKFTTLACTYDATGGVTAMNGAVLYQDGAVVASTATNNAAYTFMTNTTAIGEIGADTAGTADFFSGAEAMAIVVAGVLSAGKIADLDALCRRYFGA